jgi:hypothetical protein
MVAEDLSLIRFTTMNFFAVLLQSRPFQPISTLLIKIVYSLISSEPEPNKDDRKRLDWIYGNTHKEVKEPLSIVELAVFKNLDRGLNREIDLGDKTFTLTALYSYLDEVALELSSIVISIAKRYSIDIPIQALGSMQTTQQTIQF